MTDQTQTVVMSGFGPSVRFKTKGTLAAVQVATTTSIRTVPLSEKGTSLAFHRAA